MERLFYFNYLALLVSSKIEKSGVIVRMMLLFVIKTIFYGEATI